MAYGIEVKRTATDTLLSLTTLGGRVFLGNYSSPAAVTSIYDFPDVPSHTNLFYYVLQGGGHTFNLSTVNTGSTTYARIELTRAYTVLTNFRNNPATLIAVFASNTVEPTYGISLTNESGLRTASTNYPVPVFIQKITFDPNISQADPLSTLKTYISVASGLGKKRLVFYTVPTNSSTEVYYKGNSYLDTYDTTIYVDVSLPTSNTPHALPEAYVFSLEPVQSSETYGIRIFNSSGQITFDSGLQHLDLTSIQSLSFVSSESAITGTIDTNSAILLPQYAREVSVGRTGETASDRYLYDGVFRRSSSTTVVTRELLTSSGMEDAYYNYNQILGYFFNNTMVIDTTKYPLIPNQPLTLEIVSLSTTTPSCTYNTWQGATSCTTAENLAASTIGGNGTALSYSWSLDATAISSGYTITNGANYGIVTITNSTSAGTKPGTITVAVTQSGSTIYKSYSLNHVHVGAVSNITGYISLTSGTEACSYNSSSASSCTSTAVYSVSTSGGSGSGKSYSWSLTNNTGALSISGSSTGTTVTITKTASSGSYSATLNCIVTQSGAPNSPFTITQAITFSHIVQSGNVVQPIPGTTLTNANVTAREFAIATDNVYGNTTTAYVRLYLQSNGQGYIVDSNNPTKTVAYSTWWWSGASFDPVTPASNWSNGVPGIGNSYWVKFTRMTYTGTTNQSTPTSTSWLQLSTDQYVEVQVSAGPNYGETAASATYKIEISSDSSGTNILSTTNGPKLTATATITQ